MRDRLIELIKQGNIDYLCSTGKAHYTFLADYLLANGVIVPHCKVGDTVYYLAKSLHTHIEKVKSGKVLRIAITENGIDLFVDNWTAKLPYGKRVFLTKEEAEEKLKKGQ